MLIFLECIRLICHFRDGPCACSTNAQGAYECRPCWCSHEASLDEATTTRNADDAANGNAYDVSAATSWRHDAT